MMNNCARKLTLLMVIIFHMSFAQPNLVTIKSHKVLTSGISFDKVNSIYNNDTNPKASFYSLMSQTVEVEFDLGKNHIIDHVLIRMKREKDKHILNLEVGNDYGRLLYNCEIVDEASDIYKCQPVCRSTMVERPGIIARRFIMKLFVPSSWISVYSIEVYSVATRVSEYISSDRLVLPLDCAKASWLLTSTVVSTVASSTSAEVVFEKQYIVTEVQAQFGNAAPTKLELSLISLRKENISLIIVLSECQLQNFIYTCAISENSFPSKLVRLITPGLTKFFIKGKPVFYPKVEIKTSMNTKQKLLMTCQYSQCDLSVHSDCTHGALKSGVVYQCLNKQLVRVPNGLDQNSYIIVNQGSVEPAWQSTQFTVDSVSDKSMTVSMPRSYHYFGQFNCACIVGDKMKTVIMSNSTDLNVTDFLEDLTFGTLVQYKLSENENSNYLNVSNNIIYLSKSHMESSYFPMKITTYSLIPGNDINSSCPTSETESEVTLLQKSTAQSIKAFESISESWSVATHRYIIDEQFPVFVHKRAIVISSNNSKYAARNQESVVMLDEDKVKMQPVMLLISDRQMVIIKVVYQDKKEAHLIHYEKSCSGTNRSQLATFTSDTCSSTDKRVTCSKIGTATLVLFKDERNYAKEIIFDLLDSISNHSIEKVSVKNNITFTKEDVTVKHRYTGLSASSKNKNGNVVKIRFDVISKVIGDFTPCGTVLVKISIPHENEQKLVLQKSFFYLDVDMTSQKTNVTITIAIEGAVVEHVTEIEVTDPTSYEVKDFEFQENQAWELVWNGIEEIAMDVLDSYELKMNTTILACNSTKTDVRSIPKLSGIKNRYQGPMAAISKKHSITISASIQPIFVGNIRGQLSKINKSFHNIGTTDISMEEPMTATEITITVKSSQIEIPCDIDKVDISLAGVNGEKPNYVSTHLGNLKYKITKLIPGRKYQVSAKVRYKHGPEDAQSKAYTFETWDDISVLQTQHVAQIGDKVNISCTADIGPDGTSRKKVEWLRADKSVLPDGVKSVSVDNNPRLVYLIMEIVLSDYSGEYGCFAIPSASFGSMKIAIIVNDLRISLTEKFVDFSKQSEKVTVACTSTAVNDNNLKWRNPSGMTIQEGDSELYTIEKLVTEQKVHNVTLTIKKVSLNTTGIYQCRKSIGNTEAIKEFLLYGNEKLDVSLLPNSSYYVGEKLRLRCKGDVGLKTQKVVWEVSHFKDHQMLMKPFYPNPLDETTMDIDIVNSLAIREITCRITPALKTKKDYAWVVVLQSKVIVNGPKEVNAGQDVKLTCLGYPTNKDVPLEWLFYSRNSTNAGSVIKTSEKTLINQPHEPIKLELSLTKLREDQAGRYECKFKQSNVGRARIDGGVISLSVNAVMEPVVQISPIKDAPSMYCNNSNMYLLPALLLALFRVIHNP